MTMRIRDIIPVVVLCICCPFMYATTKTADATSPKKQSFAKRESPPVLPLPYIDTVPRGKQFILTCNSNEFANKVNYYLCRGWRVVPGTVATSRYTGYLSEDCWCVIVLEK